LGIVAIMESETVRRPIQENLAGTRPDATYEALFRRSRDCVTVIDCTGPDGAPNASSARTVYVNPAFTELTGYKLGDIASRPAEILDGTGSDRRELARIRRAIAYGRSARAEIQGFARDGCGYWAELSISPIDGQIGGSIGGMPGGRHLFLVIQRDITERRQEVEILRDSNRRLQEAIDSVSQAITLWDAEDRLLLHNRPFTELFAATAHLIRPGARFERLLRANVQAGVYRIDGDPEEWMRARLDWRRGKAWDGDQTLTLADGRRFRVSEHQTSSGHLVAAWIDVTEIKRVEQRLMDAIESVNEGFVLWDADQKLVLCNSRYRALSAEGGQHPAPALVPPVPVPGGGVFGLDGGLDGGHEEELPDGRWLLGSYRRTSEGGVVGIKTDITLLKRQELRLKANEESLRVHVAELEEARGRLEAQTAALSQLASRYLTARDNAEEANRIKSQFLAMMSHELRTPLNAIIGFSEMIETQALGPVGVTRYVEYARDVHTSGRHLLELINDILDMSKVEAGKYVLHRTEVEPRRAIRHCVRMVRLRADEAAIDLIEEVPAALPMLWADERALNQILLNLLSNAIKFTNRGGRVTISAELVGPELRLMVSDTGIGIAAEDMERVGTPFEQIDNSHTRKHAGTGLGLALTRSLTELHGGRLEIKSELGVGTRIAVVLPLCPVAA
jgi:PAS domain S-box-containing protein